jgi:hypothetical protein
MTQKKLNLTLLKQRLNQSSKEELIKDIAELFKRFDSVKDFYAVKFSAWDEAEVVEKYKKVIEGEFFPSRGFGRARLSVAKKAISDCKKVGVSSAILIDVMIFYVEQGVKFTNEYGEINDTFYTSMENVYEKALEQIVQDGLHGIFEERCRKIVEDTKNMGWGFHDGLSYLYSRTFE